MERKQVIAGIRQYVQKISQISHMIETYGNDHPQVELDLLQKNITLLFENYVRLRMSYENGSQGHVNKTEPEAPKITAPPKVETPSLPPVEEKKESQLGFKFEMKNEAEEKPVKEVIDFSLNNHKDEREFNLDKAIEEASDISIGKKITFAQPETGKAETLSPEQKELTLNDRFSETKKDLNLASKHLSTPISDLTKEISLNKKFGFINELFKGNMEQYHQAIQQLNSAGSWNKAKDQLDQLHSRFEWDAEDSLVQDFLELVKRRWS
jgi:hypothetical protein